MALGRQVAWTEEYENHGLQATIERSLEKNWPKGTSIRVYYSVQRQHGRITAWSKAADSSQLPCKTPRVVQVVMGLLPVQKAQELVASSVGIAGCDECLDIRPLRWCPASVLSFLLGCSMPLDREFPAEELAVP